MKAILLTMIILLSLLNILVVIISDSERIYKELNKKQLYRLSILKDIINSIIIVSLVSLAFI